MRKIVYMFVAAVCGMTMVACGDHNVTTSDKEAALKKVVPPYVNNTVIATYSAMGDAGLLLLDDVQRIEEAVEKGTGYESLMKQAGEHWREMRHHWEQSEAFLYGPAEKHTIDPHIDSWPLDYNAMNALLANEDQMQQIEEEGGAYVGDKLGYALKGFHAAEYLLFEEGRPHACNLTKAEAIYLVGIVEDLVQQAILLEDCWAGGVSAEKEAVITDEEGESMSYDENYGEWFINASHPSWKTYQAVAEQIVAGCVDIAGEVADLKLGNPYRGSDNGGDSEYLESPYSRTSTTDFVDNILSIQHAYAGAKSGDDCVADYVKKQNAELNTKVLKTIDDAIAAIKAIQNFETTAQNNPQVKAAIDKVSELEEILDEEVLPLLAK
ncbi:MAG: hypothetical protein J6T19_05825 [Paludibacteraceae bacterium]|nr:hypothetical protein [Paludibacteraceae bacterium]